MLESLKNIFAVADLRKRVLFTLGLLALYRIGSTIPTPGINPDALRELMTNATGVFGLYDMFSGQNLSQMTIFALGIMPYISASIILQLLTVVWPYLERLSKEGELGRRKITQYTRYGTIGLAIVQAFGIAIFLERNTDIAGGLPRSEEHTSELQSQSNLVCRLLLEKKKEKNSYNSIYVIL